MDNLNLTPNARLLLEGEQMDYTREEWQKMLDRAKIMLAKMEQQKNQ